MKYLMLTSVVFCSLIVLISAASIALSDDDSTELVKPEVLREKRFILGAGLGLLGAGLVAKAGVGLAAG